MIKQIPAEKEIFDTISTIIVEALRIDSAQIKMDSKLFLDLSAESIDILDIRFRIEEAFGFKINQNHLIESLGDGLNASQIQEIFTVKSLVTYIIDQLKQRNKES